MPNSAAVAAQPNRISSRPGGSAGFSATDRPITFWGILDAFRRRWIPALGIAVPAALLVAGLLWQMIPAEYESSALLKIHQYEQRVATSTNERTSDFLTYRNSQINFLRSRPVLTSAVQLEGVRECRLMRDKEYPVEWLEEKLDVDNDYSEEFIRISLSGEYPADLALVVDAVKDVYLDEVVYNERNERIKLMRTAEEKFTELDRNVRMNQQRIDKLAEDLGTGDSKVAIVNQGLIQQQLRELQSDLREINSRIREEEALRQYLRERGLSSDQMNSALPGIGIGPLTSGGLAAAGAAGAPSVSPSQQQLALLEQQIRRFKSQIRNPNHPDLVALEQQKADLIAAMTGIRPGENEPGSSGLTMSTYDWLNKQKVKLESEIKEQTEVLQVMGTRAVELEREKEDIKYLVDTRDRLAQEIANRKIELDAPQRVSVIQNANVPEMRSVKKRSQLATIAGLGVFGAIVAGFTFFEWFSHRLGSPSEVTRDADLRLVGTLPSPDKGGLLGLGVFAGRVDYDEWNRAVIESMDVVRTYLMRHVEPSRPASILITSASANEGKTTVSCQLAASLARAGKKVALVDCDFRRPSAHMMMEGQPGPGICEFLRGEASLESICQSTPAPSLTFIAAGHVNQSTLQHLSGDGGRSLISLLKQKFDFVVIDTSPMLFVAEPSMLAQNVDMVLLSTRRDYSRIPYVIQCRDSLRSLQVPLVGSVMVGADADFQRSTYGYRQEISQVSGQARGVSQLVNS